MTLPATSKDSTSDLLQTKNEAAEADPKAAPMVQRLGTHRDRVYMAILALENEKLDLVARRDHVRQQLEAVDQGFAQHLQDIEAALKLYEAGFSSLAENRDQ